MKIPGFTFINSFNYLAPVSDMAGELQIRSDTIFSSFGKYINAIYLKK